MKWNVAFTEYMKWNTNPIPRFTFDYVCPLKYFPFSEHEGYYASQCVTKACRLFYCPLAFVQIIAASHNVLRALGIFLHLFFLSEVLLVQQNERLCQWKGHANRQNFSSVRTSCCAAPQPVEESLFGWPWVWFCRSAPATGGRCFHWPPGGWTRIVTWILS